MVLIYFRNGADKNARTYDTSTNKYNDVCYYDMLNSLNKENNKNKYFHIFKGYECNDEGLKSFALDFMMWSKELKENNIFKFDYVKCGSHINAVIQMYRLLCDQKVKEYEFDLIDSIEYEWIEMCNNSGLKYCKPQKCESYGYDFRAFFPTILNSTDIQLPTKQGKEYRLKELDFTKLMVGYYNVNISSLDERFNKIFNYSKFDVYTNISLLLANKCKEEQGWDISIELYQRDGDIPNCYLYGKTTKDDIYKSSNIFKTWHKVLMNLKNEYPQNKLIKHMLSSLWGCLCKHNKLFKTNKQIQTEKLRVSNCYDLDYDYYIRNVTVNKNDDILNELVNTKKPYRFDIARIKPFLLDRSRYITAKIAMLYIDDVVRIQTDNITFNKEHDDIMTKYLSFPTLIKEDKTSGLIEWYHVNCYKNLTSGKMTGKRKCNDDDDDDDNE